MAGNIMFYVVGRRDKAKDIVIKCDKYSLAKRLERKVSRMRDACRVDISTIPPEESTTIDFAGSKVLTHRPDKRTRMGWNWRD